jgi:hypothetical protein
MSDRGMKKWAPYKSLDQQADFLAKMAYERGKKPRPLHSSDEAEEINDFLLHYDGGTICLSYFCDGYTTETTGKICEINTIYKYLKINDNKIDFRDIVCFKNADETF